MIIAVLIAWTLVGASSLLFYRLRSRQGLEYGFGTELFAVLFSVDLAIAIGAVDPGALIWVETIKRLHPLLAATLAIVVIIAATISIDLEVKARDGWQRYEARRLEMSKVQRMEFLRTSWVMPFVLAWTVRAATSTLHLVWIIRVPKWAIH
jgi:hypothetical protein